VKKVFPRARHQYCQVHYVANLGEPVVKMDRELRNDVKEEFRGKVAEIEKSIRADTGEGKALNLAESEVLLDLCEGIRHHTGPRRGTGSRALSTAPSSGLRNTTTWKRTPPLRSRRSPPIRVNLL